MALWFSHLPQEDQFARYWSLVDVVSNQRDVHIKRCCDNVRRDPLFDFFDFFFLSFSLSLFRA